MKKFIRNMAPPLLILLFVYAAAGKLLDFAAFRGQLHNQNIPGWAAEALLYTLVPLELLAAGLLVSAKGRTFGLLLSTLLLFVFTGYIALVLLGLWDRIPCSCGGILTGMSWGTHLVFNTCFLALSFSAWLLASKEPT